MSHGPKHNYTWENPAGNLVFEFTIPTGEVPGIPPAYMTLYLYSKENPDSKIFRESIGGEIVFADANLNGNSLNGKIWLDNSSGNHGFVESDLRYGQEPFDQELEGALAEYRFGPGKPAKPVHPVIPVSPDDPWETDAMVTTSKAVPLFPFIDVQGWPALSTEEQNEYFVNYPVPAVLPQNSFFTTLQAATTRELMEQAAVNWVGSASFISQPDQLKGLISDFFQLDGEIENEAAYDPALLVEWIAQELKISSEEITGYLKSPDYENMRDEVWQSWFALVILNGGYRKDVFHMLTRTIVFCHFAERIVDAYNAITTTSPKAQEGSATEQEKLPAQAEATGALAENSAETNVVPVVLQPALPGTPTIKSLLHASVLLQSPPFPVNFPPAATAPPLPAAATSSPPSAAATPLALPAWEQGWVAPYAVGKLQLVNTKLIGYKGGDLAHVENVMRGEKRETKRRKFSRTEEKELRKESNSRDQLNSSRETKNNFEREALKAAAESFTAYTYDNLTNTYGGPATFTLNGSLEKVYGDTTPAQSSASGFAEHVITKTIQRVRQQVDELRQRVQTDETEESTSSIFDNTLGTQNLKGIYRWLNKVYEARTVSYGSRLLIEFMIKEPAKTFIKECKRLYGVNLAHPKKLADFNIHSYHDIIFSPPLPPATNTAPAPQPDPEKALLYFNINDWPLEPAATKIISVVLQAGQRINIPLPEGYSASTATVTLPLNINTSPAADPQAVMPVINGIIGQSAFDNTIASPIPVTMNNETGSVGAVLFDILVPQQAAIIPLPSIPTLTPPSPPSGSSDATSSSASTPSKAVSTTAASPPVISEISVSITITCIPTPEIITLWQRNIFKLLYNAEKQKQEGYYNLLLSTRESGGHWMPPDVSTLERHTLQQDCVDQLFGVFYSLTGVPAEPLETNPPGMFTIYEPVIAQFLNEAFEWNELSYALTTDVFHRYGNQSKTAAQQEQVPGNNLSAFVQSEYARVLVPVKPVMSLAVLYFLTTGNVWQGPLEEVPVAAQNLLAAYAVKTERAQAHDHEESSPMTFEVPTAMLVLDDQGNFISASTQLFT
jgi:hypothetical protein